MKRHTSRNSYRDEKLKSSGNEDSSAVLRARTEEERRRRRRDWMIEQEKMDKHNRLKRKMVMEYEVRRARNMSLALPEGRCNRPRRSRSESPPSRCRRTSMHHIPEDTVFFKKFETPSGTTPLFKGSEGTKINLIELRKIKVDIHRNIPGRVATNELKRDIPNKEDVVLKRRAGEGSKPIFDREEIKRAIGETEKVEEHRSVVTVFLENSENKLKTLKRHSASLSPTRTRNHSPRRTWSHHPRYDDSKHEDKGSYRSDREKDHSRERKDGERSYREHRERVSVCVYFRFCHKWRQPISDDTACSDHSLEDHYLWIESMAPWCPRRRQEDSEKAIGPIAYQAVIRESAAITSRHIETHIPLPKRLYSVTFVLLPVLLMFCYSCYTLKSYYVERET